MNSKTKIIMFTSLMLLMLLVFIGITYTYFIAIATGDEGSSVIVETANMQLLFTDFGELRMEEAFPGDIISKEFSVQNVGNASANYNIRWKGIYNEFINDELIMKFECNSYDSNNKLIGSCGNINDIVGYTTSGAIKSLIPIPIGITHKYKLTLTFIETGENQNYNQGKSFNGTLLIDTLDLNETSIRGVLVDQDNNILTNKIIEIHSDPISTITNSKGEFLLEGIEYGNHELIIKDNNSSIKKEIVITTTNNNTSVSDSTSIYWNEAQKSVVKIKIQTGSSSISKIDIEWMETDSKCFGYDNASTAITDYYCYQGNDKGLPTITDVVIPNTVTSLGAWSLSGNNLTSVTIPNSITAINYGAFYNNQISNAILPESIQFIGYWTFKTNNLTNVVIPNTVKTIQYEAFANNQLTSINIPNSVTSIGYQAFYNNKLTSFDYPGGIEVGGGVFNKNPIITNDPIIYYKNKDGTYDKSILIGYISDGTKSVTIPDGVSTIKLFSFYDERLNDIVIPNSVTTIEDYAFRYNQFIEIDLPDHLNSLGNFAFANNWLTSVVIPDDITYLGQWVFAENNLSSVTLSSNLETIYSFAFYKNKITSIEIPNKVKEIGQSAFANNQLTTLNIPNSVTSIGSNAFQYNPNLTLINIDNVSGFISGSPWGATNATIQYN